MEVTVGSAPMLATAPPYAAVCVIVPTVAVGDEAAGLVERCLVPLYPSEVLHFHMCYIG